MHSGTHLLETLGVWAAGEVPREKRYVGCRVRWRETSGASMHCQSEGREPGGVFVLDPGVEGGMAAIGCVSIVTFK